jgi:serine/threonine protein kinase
VKVLPDLAEGLSAERFVREIRFAAQLQEPHIVPVLASGTTQSGLPYYTMPFVRGESLRERMRTGQIPVDDATSILRDVAYALAYAHQLGVVHRDIKPENVLLSGGTAMVSDFGTPPYFLQAYAYSQLRKFDEAEQSLTKCNARACGQSGRPFLAYIYAASGRRAEALRILDSLTEHWRVTHDPPGLTYGIAQIYAGLGDRERALDWLGLPDTSPIDILYAGIDPIFRPLRSERRFRALLQTRGLQQSP